MKSIVLIAAAVVIAAPSLALAKGHDQGQTDTPGKNVFLETVSPAKTLGGARGNSGNTPAATKRNAETK